MGSLTLRVSRCLVVFVLQEGGLAAVAADGRSTADKSREEDLGKTDDSIVDAKESAERDVVSDAATKSATGGSLHER